MALEVEGIVTACTLRKCYADPLVEALHLALAPSLSPDANSPPDSFCRPCSWWQESPRCWKAAP